MGGLDEEKGGGFAEVQLVEGGMLGEAAASVAGKGDEGAAAVLGVRVGCKGSGTGASDGSCRTSGGMSCMC